MVVSILGVRLSFEHPSVREFDFNLAIFVCLGSKLELCFGSRLSWVSVW